MKQLTSHPTKQAGQSWWWYAGSVACLITIALMYVSFSTPKHTRQEHTNQEPPKSVTQFWSVSDASNEQSVDHTLWQAVLQRFVHPTADGINRVDYSGLAANRLSLNAYLEQMRAIDPRTLNRREQYAYWINLYNALTVDLVLEYPDQDSILNMGDGSLLKKGPWDDVVITLADQRLTLNDIEHEILRKIWQDNRIHYAVNCASLGCPNLSRDAYTGQNLDSQLDAAQFAYISHPRGVKVEGNKVQLSSIFDWYLSDFAKDETGLIQHLAQHHKALAELVATQAQKIKVSYDYDWSLNAVENVAGLDHQRD